MKQVIKKKLQYQPLPATAAVRELIRMTRKPGAPCCPPDQGDLLYLAASRIQNPDCLEIGFATGSTALYLLLGSGGGSVLSIDYRQSEYHYAGVKAVASSGLGHRHQLIEANTNIALPDLLRQARRFDVIFLDGWKTFDHLCVDTYYCNQLLKVGGVMVFDDARMPSVRRVLRLLARHYAYDEIDIYLSLDNLRLRLWHILTTRTLKIPYRAFRKTKDFAELPVSSDWNFWRRF